MYAKLVQNRPERPGRVKLRPPGVGKHVYKTKNVPQFVPQILAFLPTHPLGKPLTQKRINTPHECLYPAEDRSEASRREIPGSQRISKVHFKKCIVVDKPGG